MEPIETTYEYMISFTASQRFNVEDMAALDNSVSGMFENFHDKLNREKTFAQLKGMRLTPITHHSPTTFLGLKVTVE